MSPGEPPILEVKTVAASAGTPPARRFFPRPLVFLHLPKTGGTTLWELVARQYKGGRGHRFLGGADDLRRFTMLPPEERARFDLLTGHVNFGIHLYIEATPTYITMLRDPVERIVSHYYHCRRHEGHYLHRVIHERGLSLRDYVEQRVTYEIDNDQVRWLTPLQHLEVARGGVTRQMLLEAKRNLQAWFSVVGLVERFDDSVVLLGAAFGWTDLAYRRKNVNAERPPMEEVDPATIALIRDMNRYEIELYDFAVELHKAQIARAGPLFARRAQAFREAQAALNAQPAP